MWLPILLCVLSSIIPYCSSSVSFLTLHFLLSLLSEVLCRLLSSASASALLSHMLIHLLFPNLSSVQFFPLLRSPLFYSFLSYALLSSISSSAVLNYIPHPTHLMKLEIPSRAVWSCWSVLLSPCTYSDVICRVESWVLGSPSWVRLWVLLLCVLSVPLNLPSAHALFWIS